METANTRYGLLRDLSFAEYFDNGVLSRCVTHQQSPISLPCGTFVPQFEDDGKRKKLTKSLTFYESGAISSIILQDVSNVLTKIGSFPAEMIMFYESGAVKRIFPVFGCITAFWSQEDEYEFCKTIDLPLPFGTIHCKVINLAFYETGELKSVTLWPKDYLKIPTPTGELLTRVGFCLYHSGNIKSLEPKVPVGVKTPIGTIVAFDPDALGIDGESNSLVFSEDGSVKSLLTSCAQVTVCTSDGKKTVHAPTFKDSFYFDNKQAVVPIKLSFANGWVKFSGGKQSNKGTYEISAASFIIEDFQVLDCYNTCEDCLK